MYRDCSENSVSSKENSPGIPTERPEQLTTDKPCDISARLSSFQPSVASDEEDPGWSAPAVTGAREDGADSLQ